MEDLYNRKLLKQGEKLPETLSYYPAICNADLKKFAKALENHSYAKHFKVDAIKKVLKNEIHF